MHSLGHLFNPKSIAVVDTSDSPFKWGYIMLANILDGGYKGKIYPINKKEKKIQGLDVYSDIESISDDVDLVIIVIPANDVMEELQKCIRKKVKPIILVSSDFSEAGNIEKEKKLQIW